MVRRHRVTHHLPHAWDCFCQITYDITGASSTGPSAGLTLATARTLFALDPSQLGLLSVASTTQMAAIIVGTAISLTITAADATGLTSTTSLTLTVSSGNLPPVVVAGQVRSVLENAAQGTPIGAPLAASDASGLPLTFSVTSTAAYPDAALWVSVDAGTGQLRVARAGLDFESPSQPRSFPVLVTVTNGAMSGSEQVTVTVLDVDEAPLCTLPDGAVFRVDENVRGVALTKVSCWGVDAAISLTFSVWKVREVCRIACPAVLMLSLPYCALLTHLPISCRWVKSDARHRLLPLTPPYCLRCPGLPSDVSPHCSHRLLLHLC